MNQQGDCLVENKSNLRDRDSYIRGIGKVGDQVIILLGAECVLSRVNVGVAEESLV